MRKRLEIMGVSHFEKGVVPKNLVSDSRAPTGALLRTSDTMAMSYEKTLFGDQDGM